MEDEYNVISLGDDLNIQYNPPNQICISQIIFDQAYELIHIDTNKISNLIEALQKANKKWGTTMKTGNFPAKINGRRIRAMERLLKKNPESPEIKTLKERITDNDFARSIKTGKNRSDKAKVK